MNSRILYLAVPLLLAAIGPLSGCAAQPTVIERLDARTAVTITNSRTPLILSPDTVYADGNAREYVQFGAIEVNRQGSLEYFIWLGIWDIDQINSGAERPDGYDSVHFVVDGATMPLTLHGWTHASIGASTASYKKIFNEDVDAYYKVTLEQIGTIANASELKLRTTSDVPKELVPWYNQEKAGADLAEFFRTVSL